MAISGFMPAWMKISNSDKSNDSQKLSINRSSTNNNKRQLQNEINASILKGQYCNKLNGHQSSTDLDEQSENLFSFQSRRSYSRESVLNSFVKDSEVHTNDHSSFSSNNHLLLNSNTNLQRRLHSIGTSSYNNSHISNHNRTSLTNGISLERLSNDNHENQHEENNSNRISKPSESKFDRIEKDFPSLNGRDLSSNKRDQLSIWNNASSRFRTSNRGKLPRTFETDRLKSRRDRLLSTPNNFNANTRSMIHELQTNYMTQTKNLDKRDFLNSLKNASNNENKHSSNESSKSIENSNENFTSKSETLVLLSLSETLEEKDLLIRMGWNDDMAYEITEQDREEYEKRIKFVPKTDNRSTTLIKALYRRSLPCINIHDLLQHEMIDSTSDDDSSDD